MKRLVRLQLPNPYPLGVRAPSSQGREPTGAHRVVPADLQTTCTYPRDELIPDPDGRATIAVPSGPPERPLP